MQKEEKIVRGADLATTGQKIKSYVLEQIADKQDTIDTVNVSVDNTTGTPSASASISGGIMNFAFSGIKGDTGATGATGKTGPQGPQGPQGNPGSSVDYPFELENDPTVGGTTKAATAESVKTVHNEVSQLGLNSEGISEYLDMSNVSKTIPTRNGSKGNAGNAYAVVWLDIPCAGYKKIRFRLNKEFAAAGNAFMFCYTLPDGTFRDKLPEDYAKGFYQDSIDKWLELSVEGLQAITIQAYETSFPLSYPSTFSALRVNQFTNGQGLEYYFTTGKIEDLEGAMSKVPILTNYNLFRVIEGQGHTFSDYTLYGLQRGEKYIFNLSRTSWDITGVTSGNRFAITSWHGNSYQTLVAYFNAFPTTNEIEFTVPEDSDYINIGGRAAVGEKIAGYITEAELVPESLVVGKKKVTSESGSQGLAIVGDIITQFNPSVDDHSQNAYILRWQKDTFASISRMTHNLGHAATIDYNSEVDALVVGNGTSDTSVAPRMDIVLNAAEKIAAGGHLAYTSPDIIHIELKTSAKEIGGSGLICCYGGNWREVFLATGQNAPRKIFRCLLGVGDQDFSDTSEQGNDVTRWGTFISGKTDAEYNGTLKVISTYTGKETEVYQGMCYRAGFIYLACGYSKPLIHKIQLCDRSKYKIVQTNVPEDYNPDGTSKTAEPEGLCFYDANTMLVGLPAYGGIYEIDSF